MVSSCTCSLILQSDSTCQGKLYSSQVEEGFLEDDWDFLPTPRKSRTLTLPSQKWAKISSPLESKPEHTPDHNTKKPEDRDKEMDGEKEPRVSQDPECKGEWKPQQMDNPDYNGVWIYPQSTTKYSPTAHIIAYHSFAVLGLDLWQVTSSTIFDNFLITKDEACAEEFGMRHGVSQRRVRST